MSGNESLVRYEVRAGNYICYMKPVPEGDWVRYTDAKKIIAELEQDIAERDANDGRT